MDVSNPEAESVNKLESMMILEKAYIQQLFKVYDKLGSIDINTVEQVIMLDKIEKEISRLMCIELSH